MSDVCENCGYQISPFVGCRCTQESERESSSLRSACSPPRHLDRLADNYLESYGCISCMSDDHRCTCIHDKAVIRAFVEHLKANAQADRTAKAGERTES